MKDEMFNELKGFLSTMREIQNKAASLEYSLVEFDDRFQCSDKVNNEDTDDWLPEYEDLVALAQDARSDVWEAKEKIMEFAEQLESMLMIQAGGDYDE